MTMNNRVVWVTGASAGIGEACALEFGRRGAFVILTARRKDKLASVRNRFVDPAMAAVLPGDLTDSDSLPALAAQAATFFGRIDVVLHNAGISQRSAAVDTSLKTHRHVMELNYFAPVELTRLVVPAMLERGEGQVAFVSSIAGHVSTPLRCAYAASKRAILGYADALRLEVGDRGVAVTSICPGFVATDITLSALTGEGEALGERSAVIDAGLAPARVAARIADALEARDRDLLIGGKEVFAARLSKVAPGLVDRLIKRATTT